MRVKRYLQSIGVCFVFVTLTVVQWGCEPVDEASSSPSCCPESNVTTSSDLAPATLAEAAPQEQSEEIVTELLGTPQRIQAPLGLPPVPIPADNKVTVEKVALGKKLYFDKQLSKDGTLSCATCHDPAVAWTEHRATSKGIEGQIGGANSPTVINSAYAPAQFWDGRAKDLEEQALGPIENPIEMGHNLDDLVVQLNKNPEYKLAFQKIFATDVTKKGIAKAIATFERTVLSGNSPYDKFQAGDKKALNDSQKHGMELFESIGCATCHTPPLFSNYRYYNAGVGMDKKTPDQGRKAVTEKDSDLGKYRVPMLREVANTGPYFHDGSGATLEDAVALMVSGGKDNPKLSSILKSLREQKVSDQDKKDLVEFLKALSGEFPSKDG